MRDAEGPGRLAKAELRRAGQTSEVHNDTVTPPCVMPMYDKDAYYMFGDFNHHHQVIRLGQGDRRSEGDVYSERQAVSEACTVRDRQGDRRSE